MHALVGTARPFVLLLDALGQVHALPHVAVLHDFEYHVALGLVGGEALVGALVVAFERNDRIFALGHGEVFIGSGHTE